MTEKLTSYDVPQWMRDRINASTYEEVEQWQNSVKSPNQCATGDPDLEVWWACQAVLSNRPQKQELPPMITDHQLAVIEWVNSPAYNEE